MNTNTHTPKQNPATKQETEAALDDASCYRSLLLNSRQCRMECQKCGGHWVSPQNLDMVIRELDLALEKIRLAVNALKHHHISRPGIAAIVRLLSENTPPTRATE